jgi:hypothetical protein
MEVLQLATPIKGKSYPDLVLEIEVSGEGWKDNPGQDKGRPFPADKENYLRSLISRTIKPKYPHREYSAFREELQGTKVIMIRRFK